jgi:hypothetical protein
LDNDAEGDLYSLTASNKVENMVARMNIFTSRPQQNGKFNEKLTI